MVHHRQFFRLRLRAWQSSFGARLALRTYSKKTDVLDELVSAHGDRALVLTLDVTSTSQIDRSVAEAEAHFGRIDVLTNAAGYGYLAAIEEGEPEAVRALFKTNVFGLVKVTKRVLPGMRSRRNGSIVNFSSLGGLLAFAATGYYHATKFAVEGISESLWHELKPLGIHVTIVEPGAFRTDWAGRSMIDSKITIDDYAETAGKRRTSTRAVSGKQSGDPVRAAAAIIQAVEANDPPLRLLLGTSALKLMNARLDALRENFTAWQETTISADFPEAQNI